MPSRALAVKAALCANTSSSGSRPSWSGTGSRPRTVVARSSHGFHFLPIPASLFRRASAFLDEPFLSTRRHHHHNSIPMDATLGKIFANNAQWAEAVNAAEPGFFEGSAKGQAPKVLWLGCSDSRVPESVITASPPGAIFVHRNIANQIHPDDESALAAITYSVGHLNSIEHILVVGHTQCGGAKAALQAATGPIPPVEPVLLRWLTPLVELASSLNLQDVPHEEALMRIVEASVRAQVENVANSEPVRKAWEGGQKNLHVHGVVYDLETGLLRDLNVTKGPK